jgi:hypothetical protein
MSALGGGKEPDGASITFLTTRAMRQDVPAAARPRHASSYALRARRAHTRSVAH